MRKPQPGEMQYPAGAVNLDRVAQSLEKLPHTKAFNMAHPPYHKRKQE